MPPEVLDLVVAVAIPIIFVFLVIIIRARLGTSTFYAADILAVFLAIDLSLVLNPDQFIGILHPSILPEEIVRFSSLWLCFTVAALIICVFYEFGVDRKKTVSNIVDQTKSGRLINVISAVICVAGHIGTAVYYSGPL